MFQNEYIHETREKPLCVLKDSRLTYITNFMSKCNKNLYLQLAIRSKRHLNQFEKSSNSPQCSVTAK